MQLPNIKVFAALQEVKLLSAGVLWQRVDLVLVQEEGDVASWVRPLLVCHCRSYLRGAAPRGTTARILMAEVESVWDLSDSQSSVHRRRNQSLEDGEVVDLVVGQLCWRKELVVLEDEDILPGTLGSTWYWVLLEHIVKGSL